MDHNSATVHSNVKICQVGLVFVFSLAGKGGLGDPGRSWDQVKPGLL